MGNNHTATPPPLIIAHRGASHAAPENTLPAFELAWREGADGIEGDFHLTADGQVVCIHDADTARVAGEKLIVCEQSLTSLRRLDVGAWRGAAYRGTTIPTLAEVLAIVPANKVIEIEIKCGAEIIPPLLADINRAAIRPQQITFISFDARVIAALKVQAPQYRALYLSKFQSDTKGNGVPSLTTLQQTLSTCNADGVGSCPHIPRAIADALLAQNYCWTTWTIDNSNIARRLQQWGVYSITTNTPAALRQALNQTLSAAVTADN